MMGHMSSTEITCDARAHQRSVLLAKQALRGALNAIPVDQSAVDEALAEVRRLTAHYVPDVAGRDL